MMKENNISSVMEALVKGMDGVLSTKTVVGEATQIGDVIILPLVDVSFGVGAGASGDGNKNGATGGMGGKMSPSAILVIQNGKLRLVNVKNQDAVTKVLDMVPDLVDKFNGKFKKGVSKELDDETISEIAFPEEG